MIITVILSAQYRTHTSAVLLNLNLSTHRENTEGLINQLPASSFNDARLEEFRSKPKEMKTIHHCLQRGMIQVPRQKNYKIIK